MKKITFRFTKASGFRSRSTVVSAEEAAAITQLFSNGQLPIDGTEQNGTAFILSPDVYKGAILEVLDVPAPEAEGEQAS